MSDERIIPPNRQPVIGRDKQYVLRYQVEGSSWVKTYTIYAVNYDEAEEVADGFLSKNPRRQFVSLTESRYRVYSSIIILLLVAGALHWLFPSLFYNLLVWCSII